MLRFKRNEQKLDPYWLVDYSFFIYNGTYAQKRECDCSGKNPECPLCSGSGKKFLQTSDGIITGGIYSVLKMLIERMNEGYKCELVFDPPKANLDRSQLIDGYKGNRAPKPEFITAQMDLGRELFSLTNKIGCYTSDNDESDDVLAARALELANKGHRVILASDDKDEFPVLDHPNITLLRQKQFFTKQDFINKFGFGPNRFSEYLAIVGDAADNYNLIKGLGPKAAEWFIDRYPLITDLWEDWDNLPDKYKKKLVKACTGDTCAKCKSTNTKPCENRDCDSVETIKLKDELDTSLKLAYLNLDANYYKLDNLNDRDAFANELKRLELKSALYNINMFF